MDKPVKSTAAPAVKAGRQYGALTVISSAGSGRWNTSCRAGHNRVSTSAKVRAGECHGCILEARRYRDVQKANPALYARAVVELRKRRQICVNLGVEMDELTIERVMEEMPFIEGDELWQIAPSEWPAMRYDVYTSPKGNTI